VKLEAKLAATLSLGTALILALCFSLAYILVRRDEQRDLDAELAELGEQVQAELGQPATSGGNAPTAFDEKRGLYLALYTQEGALLRASTHFATLAPRVLPASASGDGFGDRETPSGSDPLRWLTVKQDSTVLLVATSRAPMESDMGFLRRVLGGLFVLGLAGAFFTARLAARSVARDIARVAEVARKVAMGDLAQRVSQDALASEETKELGEDLNQMVEDLERIIKTQKVFVSHAAHELRSPLATMRGELQLCLRKERTREEYQATLEAVDEQAAQLGALAESLLSLARSRDAQRGDSKQNARAKDILRGAQNYRAPFAIFSTTLQRRVQTMRP
jgi:two-component system, OmpR family, sensor kinase